MTRKSTPNRRLLETINDPEDLRRLDENDLPGLAQEIREFLIGSVSRTGGHLSGGQAFEALNNAGNMDANLLVILNDNDMSISPNVGAMSQYLARILSGKVYSHMREGSKTVLSTIPPMWELAKRVEEHTKGMG